MHSYLTPPSDEALRFDVEITKKLGFNAARKHQKIEDPRWLYRCDRLGLLVRGKMANARAWSLEAEERLLAEWDRAIRRDYNDPCIITWVPVKRDKLYEFYASFDTAEELLEKYRDLIAGLQG